MGQQIVTTPHMPASAVTPEAGVIRLVGRWIGASRPKERSLAAVLAAVAVGASSWAFAEDPPGALSSPLQHSQPPDAQGGETPGTRGENEPAGPGESPSNPEAATPLQEERPPVGRGKLLSGAQLRYCLAQSIRIDAVRTLLNRSESAEVEHFNRLVTDFNKRCASYRYEVRTLADARRDVDDHRSQLEKSARETYLKRFEALRRKEATRAAAQLTPQPPKEAQHASAPRAETGPVQPDRPVEARPPPQETKPEIAIPAATPQPPRVAQPSPPAPAPAPAPEGGPGEQSAASRLPTSKPDMPAPALTPQAQIPKEAPLPLPPVPERLPAAGEQSQERSQPPPASNVASRADAGAASDGDPALRRFTREIQQAGSQVVGENDYPEQAIGKRWEGTTQIEVRFDAGGYIRSIVLGESCGHPLLDEKALDLARNAAFPDVPKELHSREFTVRFPIVFRLGKS